MTTRGDVSEFAAHYARAGLAVFPMRRGSKVSLIRDWPNAATTDEAEVRELWRRWPDANVACVLGRCLGGLLVVDVDVHGSDGFATLARIEREYGPLPATATCRTGGNGEHRYFRSPSPDARFRVLEPGVEVLAGARAAILPPSVHASGRAYRWTHGGPVADLPAAWIPLVVPPPAPPRPAPPVSAPTRFGEEALRREVARVAATREGARDSTLVSAAYRVGGLVPCGAIDEHAVEAALLAAALGTGLGEHEALATIRRGLRAGAARPRRVEAHR